MLAGSQILQPPPVSHEELCSRLETTLLDISDLALPARLLKDAEALLGDWFAAERSRVERSAAPALYRAIETLSRLTSIRRTLIGLAKALMEPPRPPAPPKPAPPKPAQASPSAPVFPLTPVFTASTPDTPASSSFVVPPSGGPGADEKPSDCETREPAPANPTDPAPDQIVRPIALPKLSLTSVLTPELSPSEKAQWAFETALRDPHLPAPSPGSAPSPTPQPKRGPLVRSSAEIVSQVRSCPRLATLNAKQLELNINSIVRLKAALAYARPVPRPGRPTPAPSREHLTAQGFSFHPMPPAAAPPTSTADPPDSS